MLTKQNSRPNVVALMEEPRTVLMAQCMLVKSDIIKVLKRRMFAFSLKILLNDTDCKSLSEETGTPEMLYVCIVVVQGKVNREGWGHNF